jgi:chlorite dismutase
VYYPLRRSGRFAQLPADEQRVILAEHGAIGMSFGAGDYAHDIRLACHGLDKDDNDFVIGLIGKELFPLSAIVQTMRKDPADVAVPRAPGAVLRGTRRVPSVVQVGRTFILGCRRPSSSKPGPVVL